MKRTNAKTSIWIFLLICLLFLTSVGSVGAEDDGPDLEPNVAVQERITLTLPEKPGNLEDIQKADQSFLPPGENSELMSWTILLDEDFDSDFPSPGWTISNYHPTKDFSWGTTSYRSVSGNKSIHPGGSGADAYDPRASGYDNDMYSLILYGPMSLVGATDAWMEFERWMDTEINDKVAVIASTDGLNFTGWTIYGDFTGWNFYSYSLSETSFRGLGNLIGEPEVWVGFYFQSNSSVTDQGVFIDDVVVRKTTSSAEPDGMMVSYSVTPDLYHPGDSYSSNRVYVNVGQSPCPSYTIREVLSENTVITPSDFVTNTLFMITPLDKNAVFDVDSTPTIPVSVPPGMYYAGVIIECSGDNDTSNNTAYYSNMIEVTPVGTGGIIFQDDFESDDLTSWTRYNPGKTGLSACSAGAINGDKGACFYRPAGNDKRRQLIDETPVNQDSFNVRFSFDINGLSMLDGERFRFMQVKMGAERPFFIVLKYQSGQYWIQLNTLLDDLTKVKTGWYLLSDAQRTIEVDWRVADAPGSDDGYALLYLDGVVLESLTGLNNDTITVDTLKVGYTSRLEGKSISGTFYVDDVVTSNGGYIGLP